MGSLITLVAVVAILGLAVVASACAGSPSPPASLTVGQYAEAGKAIFANRCVKCHGDKGQGVTALPVIGQNAALAKYDTAQGLVDFVDSAMPLNAPGSLSREEYLQIVCFLLVQNNIATPGVAFDAKNLKLISLKK